MAMRVEVMMVKCKKDKSSSKYKRTYFWDLLAPDKGIVFRWSEKRNNKEAKAMLEGTKGVYVSDAHHVNSHAAKTLGLTWQICSDSHSKKFS